MHRRIALAVRVTVGLAAAIHSAGAGRWPAAALEALGQIHGKAPAQWSHNHAVASCCLAAAGLLHRLRRVRSHERAQADRSVQEGQEVDGQRPTVSLCQPKRHRRLHRGHLPPQPLARTRQRADRCGKRPALLPRQARRMGENDAFTKTGSGQARGNAEQRRRFLQVTCESRSLRYYCSVSRWRRDGGTRERAGERERERDRERGRERETVWLPERKPVGLTALPPVAGAALLEGPRGGRTPSRQASLTCSCFPPPPPPPPPRG